MNNNDFYRDQAAAANQLGNLRGLQQERTIKDPTVTDAQDAIAALRKRLDVIKTELARVPRLQAEHARIERMLAAAAPEEP